MTDNKKFILVKGDVSGIQDFIFNVKSDGAAKSLKAKSFFIKALSKISVVYLFDKLGIPPEKREECTISVSGGNFFILVPYHENGEQILKKYVAQSNLELSKIGLSIVISSTQFDSSSYSEKLEELNRKAHTTKYKLFDGVPYSDLFEPITENSNMGWKAFGTKLREANSFSIEITEGNRFGLDGATITFLSYKLLLKKELAQNAEFSLENKLDTYFPVNFYNNDPKEFKDIAEFAGKSKKLGILKIDVDNLRSVFQKCNSVENHKQLSEKFRAFFENELYKIISGNNKYKDSIYSIISGGDDCFLVGGWNKIVDLAFEINTKFRDYWSKNVSIINKNVTLSAGIVIVHQKFPVVRFALLVENALHQAKITLHSDGFESNTILPNDDESSERNVMYSTKDGLSLLGTVIKWEDWDAIKNIKIKLGNFVIGGHKSLLHNARKAVINNDDIEKVELSDFWELAYHLREVNKAGKVDELNKILELYETHIHEAIDRKDNRFRYFFPIAARLVELSTK